nr:hypothetical protein BaRGS_025935 [Batillaria attramentaria]
MTPIDVLDVDDVRQVVTSSVILTVSWTDPTLSWNDTSGQYSNLSSIELAGEEVWKPHVLFVNGASDTRMLDTYMGGTVRVQATGKVSLMSSPVLAFTCKMDLRVYPFDTQQCRMLMYINGIVGIEAVPTEMRSLSLRVVEDELAVSAEWSLEMLQVERRTLPGTDDVFLEYTWTLKRKTTYFVISFIVPIVMTSYMNVLVFIIPAENGEKISYLVSIFVSNAVFLGFCTNEMPQGLGSTPLVMYLVLGIMAESGILLIISSLILRRFHRNQQPNNRDLDPDYATLSAGSKLALPSNAVQPLENSANGDEYGDQPRRRPACPDCRVGNLDTVLFGVAFTINTMFVVLLLVHMM